MTQALDMVCSLVERAAAWGAGTSGTRSAQDLIPDHCGALCWLIKSLNHRGKCVTIVEMLYGPRKIQSAVSQVLRKYLPISSLILTLPSVPWGSR